MIFLDGPFEALYFRRMKHIRIQLPLPLFEEIQRVAKLQQWSVTEVLRRGAEYMVRCFPAEKVPQLWAQPEPLEMGPFLAPVEEWRGLASEPGCGLEADRGVGGAEGG
jgi:hypothetical protein